MRSVHLKLIQGTPFSFLVRVTQPDESDPPELVPMPLTGYSAKLQARPHIASDCVLLEMSSDTPRIEIDEEAGTFSLYLTSEETSSLVWGKPNTVSKGVFHCEITPPDGETIRVLEGTIKLDPEVVR